MLDDGAWIGSHPSFRRRTVEGAAEFRPSVTIAGAFDHNLCRPPVLLTGLLVTLRKTFPCWLIAHSHLRDSIR